MKLFPIILVSAVVAGVMSLIVDVVSMMLGAVHAPAWLFIMIVVILFILTFIAINEISNKYGSK